MAMARQTWDEVRHAQLGMGLLESYGGEVGEYPDTLAGSPPNEARTPFGRGERPSTTSQAADVMRDPLISLSVTNVALEGAALDLFKGTSDLGRKIGDGLMQHVYDYNWADEVTHTTIGDYFVKALCEDNPGEEQRALRAHAMFEGMRERLSGQQSSEIRAFFAEEMSGGRRRSRTPAPPVVLMAVRIELEACINCGLCRRACPTETIHFFTTGSARTWSNLRGASTAIFARKCAQRIRIVPDTGYVHDPSNWQRRKKRQKPGLGAAAPPRD